MTPEGSDTVRERHAELVYRWKVRQDASGKFADQIIEVLSDLVGKADIVAARVYQPVLGPGSEVWEVHLEFRNLQAAGNLLDGEGEGIGAPLWKLAGIAGERSESGVPSTELLESNAPLYRTLVLRPAGSQTTSAEAEVAPSGPPPTNPAAIG